MRLTDQTWNDGLCGGDFIKDYTSRRMPRELAVTYSKAFAHLGGISYFHGHPIQKSPTDLWMYQELLWDVKPDFIIETGTASGGSAYYYACLLDLIWGTEEARVYTIDLTFVPDTPKHPRITHVWSSSVESSTLSAASHYASRAKKVLVSLDSDHSKRHVLHEMQEYGRLVTPGSYMIVEDVYSKEIVPEKYNPGPDEAIVEFLEYHKEFEHDPKYDRFGSAHTSGWLKKVS